MLEKLLKFLLFSLNPSGGYFFSRMYEIRIYFLRDVLNFQFLNINFCNLLVKWYFHQIHNFYIIQTFPPQPIIFPIHKNSFRIKLNCEVSLYSYENVSKIIIHPIYQWFWLVIVTFDNIFVIVRILIHRNNWKLSFLSSNIIWY